MLIKSLKEINVNEAFFPVFFQDGYLKHVSTAEKTCEAWLYVNNDLGGIISFTTAKIKIITKGQYLFTPCDFEGKELAAEKEKYMVEDFHLFLIKRKMVDVILPPPHYVVFKCIPSKTSYYQIGSMFVDLMPNEDEIFNKFHKDYRKQIRKAETLSSKATFSLDLINDFYNLYQLTHKKQNIGFLPLEYFLNLIENLNSKTVVAIAYCDNNIESSLFIIKDKSTAYSWHSGTSDNPVFKGSNKFLMWEVFKQLKKEGVERYNYGGYREFVDENSKIGKITDFKLRFGSEIEQGYHFIKVINPVKYSIFNLLLKLKSKIKGKNLDLVNLDGLDIKKSA